MSTATLTAPASQVDPANGIDLSEIARRIAEAVQPTRIYLFGSRVTGNARPDSDVDLLVIYDGKRPRNEVDMDIRRRFRPRLFSLDLHIASSSEFERFKTVANTLAREANERGIKIYG